MTVLLIEQYLIRLKKEKITNTEKSICYFFLSKMTVSLIEQYLIRFKKEKKSFILLQAKRVSSCIPGWYINRGHVMYNHVYWKTLQGKNTNSSEIPLSKHEFSQIRIIVLLLFNSEIFIADGGKKPGWGDTTPWGGGE